MIPFELDWAYIRRHTMLPAATLSCALALLIAALWLNERHARVFDEVSSHHAAIHGDYASLVEQRRVVDAYHRRYRLYREMGFVARESRLDWVETLRTTTSGLALPRLGYSIEPQLPVIPPVPGAFDGEQIDLRVSRVQLDMGLVHELDLLRFFDALQAQAPGFIKVDRCELVFDGDRRALRAETNVSASCAAQIYSVITSDVTAGDES